MNELLIERTDTRREPAGLCIPLLISLAHEGLVLCVNYRMTRLESMTLSTFLQ